jgi:hypothetical protein
MLWLYVLVGISAFFGCAHTPYYPGTATQHMVPCDENNCGRKPWVDAAGYHDLALPPLFIRRGDPGGYNDPNSRESFFRQYEEIRRILEGSFPGHEFLIIPEKLVFRIPPGYEELPIRWRSHRLFKRPILKAEA